MDGIWHLTYMSVMTVAGDSDTGVTGALGCCQLLNWKAQLMVHHVCRFVTFGGIFLF